MTSDGGERRNNARPLSPVLASPTISNSPVSSRMVLSVDVGIKVDKKQAYMFRISSCHPRKRSLYSEQ